MKDKHISIRKMINFVSEVFGEETFVVKDYQDDFYAIGLEKDKKLIYISSYKLKPNHYFYECEILKDNYDEDYDMPYVASGSEDNVSERRLLQVMKDFFKLEYMK